MSKIVVDLFKNEPVQSNCYIVYQKDSKSCLIIDPGSKDSETLISYIRNKDLIPKYLILTHEHFDHVWAVNDLKSEFKTETVCSLECGKAIVNPKKNLSVFYDQIGFSCTFPEKIIEESYSSYSLDDLTITLVKTEGHTPGSICIIIGRYLFSGDTIIPYTKTVVKFPGGSREKLNVSLKYLESCLPHKNMILCPGHGQQINLELIELDDCL